MGTWRKNVEAKDINERWWTEVAYINPDKSSTLEDAIGLEISLYHHDDKQNEYIKRLELKENQQNNL